MNRRRPSSISFPRGLVWTVEDWKDFYFTLCRFRARAMRRHGLISEGDTYRVEGHRADCEVNCGRECDCKPAPAARE